jgi:hypothetical protein
MAAAAAGVSLRYANAVLAEDGTQNKPDGAVFQFMLLADNAKAPRCLTAEGPW